MLKPGNRLSLLDQARYCGQAPLLSSEHGVGRYATLSRAFHAMCAGEPDAEHLTDLLDESELETLRRLHRPTDVDVHDATLTYAEAEKEVPVGLGHFGEYVDPEDEERLTQGTLDFAWLKRVNGHKVAYVADIKLSEWTASADPNSLQLAGYAMAYADKMGADYYVTGVFHAIEGTWHWGEMVDPMGPEAARALRQIKAAVENIGEGYVTGPHCRTCYGRMHCPEHLLPAMNTGTPLDELSEGEPSQEAALEAILHAKRLEDAAKKLKDFAQEYVRRNGPIEDPQSGKRYLMTMTKGRESVSVKDLRAALGDEANKYIKRGKPYPRFIWA